MKNTNKYNKKEIMSNAWRYRRIYRWTMSECLKKSWYEAKANIEAESKINDRATLNINGYFVTIAKTLVNDFSVEGWKITGNTFKVKNQIKDLGFTWDGITKAWTTTDRANAIAIARAY